MSEEIKKFSNKLKNNENFKAKVAIWHILIAKVFLDVYFEKYYINFIKDGDFDKETFLKSVWYIDIMLNWDNYTDRYKTFEEIEDLIIETLRDDDKILLTLRQSIIFDLTNVIWKKDEDWNLVTPPYSLDFSENKKINLKVKNALNDFLQNEINNLKILLSTIEINDAKNLFLKKIDEALK